MASNRTAVDHVPQHLYVQHQTTLYHLRHVRRDLHQVPAIHQFLHVQSLQIYHFRHHRLLLRRKIMQKHLITVVMTKRYYGDAPFHHLTSVAEIVAVPKVVHHFRRHQVKKVVRLADLPKKV